MFIFVSVCARRVCRCTLIKFSPLLHVIFKHSNRSCIAQFSCIISCWHEHTNTHKKSLLLDGTPPFGNRRKSDLCEWCLRAASGGQYARTVSIAVRVPHVRDVRGNCLPIGCINNTTQRVDTTMRNELIANKIPSTILYWGTCVRIYWAGLDNKYETIGGT